MNTYLPLKSTPIAELIMSPVDDKYIERIRHYLEEELHCSMSRIGLDGYHIVFPEGTTEEVYAGQSTSFTYRTTVRFPGGSTLTKYVKTMLPHVEMSVTLLAFPTNVLYGPEQS
jgi:hypothetical protein